MKLKDIGTLYIKKLEEMAEVITDVKGKVISEGADPIFSKNVNFFTKSFITLTCANLESCLKDHACHMSRAIDVFLEVAKVPERPIFWKLNEGEYNKRHKKSDTFRNLRLDITPDEIDDMISGNVYKTKHLFDILGVNLAEDSNGWEKFKDEIQHIITKRNRIIHHNDDASDVSLDDILLYIERMKDYIDYVNKACQKCKYVN